MSGGGGGGRSFSRTSNTGPQGQHCCIAVEYGRIHMYMSMYLHTSFVIDAETYIFRWQEKVFSEVRTYI